MLKSLFKLRGKLDQKVDWIIGLTGLVFILVCWHIISTTGMVSPALLPGPLSVVSSLSELHYKDFLVRNAMYSLKLNYLG